MANKGGELLQMGFAFEKLGPESAVAALDPPPEASRHRAGKHAGSGGAPGAEGSRPQEAGEVAPGLPSEEPRRPAEGAPSLVGNEVLAPHFSPACFQCGRSFERDEGRFRFGPNEGQTYLIKPHAVLEVCNTLECVGAFKAREDILPPRKSGR